jgi:hypothetical protein
MKHLDYDTAPTQESMRPRGVVRKFRTNVQQGSSTLQRDTTKSPKPASARTVLTAPAPQVSR